MKKAGKILLILIIAVLAAVCVSCSSETQNKGYGANEPFTLSTKKYALEKWVRLPDEDRGEQEAYGLCILMVGKDAPVTFNIGTNGSAGNMRSGIDVTLQKGEEMISTRNISFAAVEDVPGYGIRATFNFLLPKGEELPKSATLFDTTDKSKSVLLNLENLTKDE